MPTISLRLTEEEHAALKAWAHDSRRSIQKEAVFRLFTEPTATAKYPPTVADSQPRDVEARSVTADQEWLMRRAGKRK